MWSVYLLYLIIQYEDSNNKKHGFITILSLYSFFYIESGLRSWLIQAEWHIYAPVNLSINGSNNGLMPNRHQAKVMLALVPCDIFQRFFLNITNLIQGNEFDNVCKMQFILSLPQWVKRNSTSTSSLKIQVCANYVLMCHLKHTFYTLHPLHN